MSRVYVYIYMHAYKNLVLVHKCERSCHAFMIKWLEGDDHMKMIMFLNIETWNKWVFDECEYMHWWKYDVSALGGCTQTYEVIYDLEMYEQSVLI